MVLTSTFTPRVGQLLLHVVMDNTLHSVHRAMTFPKPEPAL